RDRKVRASPCSLGPKVMGTLEPQNLAASPLPQTGRSEMRGPAFRVSISASNSLRRKTVSDQPRLLRVPDVLSLTGLSRSLLYQLIARGVFPRPVSVAGTRVKAWSAAAVSEWIEDQIQSNQETPE